MINNRFPFYLLSLAIGALYFALFVLAHIYIPAGNWLTGIDNAYIIFNFVIIGIMLVKDGIDERNMHRGISPAGPSWFEHGPFVFLVALQSIISTQYDTVDLIINLKVLVFFLALLDYIWDLSQDERSAKWR